MSEPFLGEIRAVSFRFAPKGWALCDGQVLPIAQNQALYSLLGNVYGGTAPSTFALPDLRGRSPLSVGQGSGLSNYTLGQAGGAETVALTSAQMPAHSHVLRASSAPGTAVSPGGNYLAAVGGGAALYAQTVPSQPPALASGTLGNAGGSAAHDNRQPYLTLNYIIALQGIFPTRS